MVDSHNLQSGPLNTPQPDPELVRQLSAHAFFGQMSTADVGELVAASELITLLPGQALWAPGEVKDAAFVLVSGRVELTFRIQPDGQRQAQYTVPGTLLTLSSLVHSWPHASAGVALERSRLLKLTRTNFMALFEAQRPCAFYLVDAIADDLVEEVRDANRRLHEVFGHPAETLRMLRRRSRTEAGGRGPQV